MSDISYIRKSLIYNEFTDDQRDQFFSFKRSKFLAHIDTLYYSVYVDSADWSEESRKLKLISDLSNASNLALVSDDGEVPIFQDIYYGLTCSAFLKFNMYKYHFSCKNFFDVFIADSVPNVKTPPIFVQLRSNALWVKGVRASIDESLSIISSVLLKYCLNVDKVVENRIDYAYHTNYIQDPVHFFPESDLYDMQVSQFKRWEKQGYFYDDEIHCDYFTLGRRKSNNVFFRVYNKTKEVVELGYKQFFLPIWEQQGLISNFDVYVLENTFFVGKWSAKERFRCQFYLIYGKDEELKRKISKMIDNPDTSFSDFKRVADKCVPDVTVVCNIEFQCKRKFFYNLLQSISNLNISDLATDRLYSIVEQTKSITKYLTYDIIRFVKYKNKYADINKIDRPLADWWCRLRSAKQYELIDYDFAEYCFAYQSNIDMQRVRKSSIKAVARTSAYFTIDSQTLTAEFDESDVVDDFIDLCSHMNDNDICVYNHAKSKAVKDINSKKMKVLKNSDSFNQIEFKKKQFKDIFMYWFYGIFYKNLSEKTFISVALSAFNDSLAYDVFLEIKYGFDTSISDFAGFSAGVARRVLEALELEVNNNEL